MFFLQKCKAKLEQSDFLFKL